MAPPIPFTILPGIIQFARLPSRSTWSAPRIVRSTWPPRTIAKESALEKYDVPGSSVTVSLPGVDEVGVLLARLGIRPDPQHAVLGVQHDRDALGDVVRGEGRHADAEVHVVAVLHLHGRAPHDPLALGVGLARRRRRAASASRSASRSPSPGRSAARRSRASSPSRGRWRPRARAAPPRRSCVRAAMAIIGREVPRGAAEEQVAQRDRPSRP